MTPLLVEIGPNRRSQLALRTRQVDVLLIEDPCRLTRVLHPIVQVSFAAEMKRAHPDIAFGAVGLITEASQAETILRTGLADAVFLGREVLRNPHWPLSAAKELRVKVKAANQYERAWL